MSQYRFFYKKKNNNPSNSMVRKFGFGFYTSGLYHIEWYNIILSVKKRNNLKSNVIIKHEV
jgi:hypothetical protein